MRHLAVILLGAHLTLAAEPGPFQWSELPPLPEALGLGGSFAGVAQGQLLVAGGANFPAGPPWSGGRKVWHDTVYALAGADASWRRLGPLPRPLGYGVSVTTRTGLLCLGGSDAQGHHPEVFELSLAPGGTLVITPLPPLPVPLADAAGAQMGNTLYLAGGAEAPGERAASARVFALDLPSTRAGWRELEPLPGPARIQALAAVADGAFYVVGGAALEPDSTGRIVRRYLADTWRYRPGQGWKRLADLPHPAAAAPSPAPTIGPAHFALLGANEGTWPVGAPLDAHPGFNPALLLYHAVTDTWAAFGEVPGARVTTPAVPWRDRWVLPSGEVRPGVRSPEVRALALTPSRRSFGLLNWTVLGFYLAGMVVIGWGFMRYDAARTTDHYFRGGQRVPWVVAGLSIFATMLSSLTFMGIPARAYQTDVTWYLGQLPILVVVPLVAFCYLPFFRQLDLTSAYEYLERRFGLGSRLFAGVSFILFHVGRVALVLYLPALALAAVSDIGLSTSIVVIGALCILYTVMGGITAVVWTDAVQAVVLLGGALLCLILAVGGVEGGWAGVWSMARADRKLFESLEWGSWSVADGTCSAGVLWIAFLFNSLVPYTSSQDVVQRYVTTPDLKRARRSLWITLWLSVFGSMIFFALGTALYAFYKSHPTALAPGLERPDSILPFYILTQLPAGLSGLVIAALFAASQSTLSSSLNSIANTWTQDFDRRLLRPGRPDAAYLGTARAVVVLVGMVGIAVALAMAAAHLESAFKTFNTMIGLTAGALGGLFALGVFTRRANATGALVGAFAGAGLVLVLHLARAPVSGLLYAFVGCGTCLVVGWLASLVLPGPRGERLSLFG